MSAREKDRERVRVREGGVRMRRMSECGRVCEIERESGRVRERESERVRE